MEEVGRKIQQKSLFTKDVGEKNKLVFLIFSSGIALKVKNNCISLLKEFGAVKLSLHMPYISAWMEKGDWNNFSEDSFSGLHVTELY